MTPLRPPPDDGIDDEVLMMFADGTLDHETMETVARALEADPALVERLAAFTLTRDRLKGAFSKPVNEQPPRRLIDAIMSHPVPSATPEPRGDEAGTAGNVLPFQPRARAATGNGAGRWIPIAMAAGFAGIAAGVAGFVTGQNSLRPMTAVAALASSGTVALASLDTARDGQNVLLGSGLAGKVSGSYRMSDRRVCRTLNVDHGPSGSAADGVVCQSGGQWRLELAVPRDEASALFRPASGAGPIDALLDAGGAQTALTAQEVEELINRNWR